MQNRNNQNRPFLNSKNNSIITNTELAMSAERATKRDAKNVRRRPQLLLNRYFYARSPDRIQRRNIFTDDCRMIRQRKRYFHAFA